MKPIDASPKEAAFELVYTGPDKDDPHRTFSIEGMAKIGDRLAKFIGGHVMGRLLTGRGPKWMRVTVQVEFEQGASPIRVVQVFDGERRSAVSQGKHG